MNSSRQVVIGQLFLTHRQVNYVQCLSLRFGWDDLCRRHPSAWDGSRRISGVHSLTCGSFQTQNGCSLCGDQNRAHEGNGASLSLLHSNSRFPSLARLDSWRSSCDFTINEALRVMHILAVTSDQKPVDSKRAVYDPSTVCRIYWFFRKPDDARKKGAKTQTERWLAARISISLFITLELFIIGVAEEPTYPSQRTGELYDIHLMTYLLGLRRRHPISLATNRCEEKTRDGSESLCGAPSRPVQKSESRRTA